MHCYAHTHTHSSTVERHTIPQHHTHHTTPRHTTYTTTTHYTTPHYTTPHTLRTPQLHTTLHHTTLHHTTMQSTTLHCKAPHYTTPHYKAPHYTTLHYKAPHHTAVFLGLTGWTTKHHTTLQCALDSLVGQMTPASSWCPQLWPRSSLLLHSSRDCSPPVHTTSSRTMGPEPEQHNRTEGNSSGEKHL